MNETPIVLNSLTNPVLSLIVTGDNLTHSIVGDFNKTSTINGTGGFRTSVVGSFLYEAHAAVAESHIAWKAVDVCTKKVWVIETFVPELLNFSKLCKHACATKTSIKAQFK